MAPQKPLFRAPAARIAPGGEATVDGEVVRVTFENPETGFRVLRVAVEGKKDPEVWVGSFPSAPAGTRVRATGRYQVDARHGEQLKVESLIAVAPSTLDGLTKYLGSGMIPGIGERYAQRIVEHFGMEALDVLDKTPERLSEVAGLGPRRIKAIAKTWEEKRTVSALMIFLQTHGVTMAIANRIYKRFGPRAMEIVSRAPYRLALDVWGVGFKTADRIAQSLGVDPSAPERAQAGVLHTLHELTTRGHVFSVRENLASHAAAMLERDDDAADEAISALEASRHVVVEGGEEAAVYPTELHTAEVRLAKRFVELMTHEASGPRGLDKDADASIARFEERARKVLAPAQRAAVELAAKHKVMVVTGGPGVGKTTIVRAILSLYDRARIPVRLAAPTGRAAKRMSEATGREATTLHRLLEFDPRKRAFSRMRGRPVEAGAIVVDEVSMLDLALADALLDAVADGARLVLVGDVDQLPSVGPGAVLRDVIESGVVPTARLTQIFRQAAGSLIVENAHRIHAGEMPESAIGKQGEFYVFEREGEEAAADTIMNLVTTKLPTSFGLDPRRDVQVLTPMHKGACGTIVLNEKLQAALNPTGAGVETRVRKLKIGDKVMQLRNDYDKDVYNGDVGFIIGTNEEERKLNVQFDERVVEYTEGELDELTLAYATSIHKSQGSEYPAVIVPILTQHFVMLSRNLIYTAVTRGKRLVILITNPRALSVALAEVRREDRKTRLAERIARERPRW